MSFKLPYMINRMIYARVGSYAMKKEIREKLDAIRLMLRKGYSLRKAIKTVGIEGEHTTAIRTIFTQIPASTKRKENSG